MSPLGVLASLAVLLCLTAPGSEAQREKKCVMYDFAEGYANSYVYDGPPIKVDEDSFRLYESWCPTAAAEFPDMELCCSPLQIQYLAGAFQNALFMFGTCPSCAHNWRTTFCHQWCSPHQSSFLSVNETIVSAEGKDLVAKLDFVIHQDFADSSYESCKNVIMPLTGDPIMDFVCGKYNHQECNSTHWFDNMGDVENSGGNAIYEIKFWYTSGNDTIEDFESFQRPTVPCDEVAPGYEAPCGCIDCPTTCLVPSEIMEIWRQHKKLL